MRDLESDFNGFFSSSNNMFNNRLLNILVYYDVGYFSIDFIRVIIGGK